MIPQTVFFFFFHFISAALFLVGEKGYICEAALFILFARNLKQVLMAFFKSIFISFSHTHFFPGHFFFVFLGSLCHTLCFVFLFVFFALDIILY